jgi:ADP-ribosylglycohydrolase
MIGAIAGDIIGSVYETHPIKTTVFPLFAAHARFTDDTVLTVATAQAVLDRTPYDQVYRALARAYPQSGYGAAFSRWFQAAEAPPYNSWGNGAAMRVSPVAWAFDDEATVLREAARSAAVTHNHPEGIRGAQATALAIWMARRGRPVAGIRKTVARRCGYDLDRSLDAIRPHYRFEVACQRSVPEAIICFLEAADFESAVRNAVSLGGDSDTQASIAGAIAEAYYGPLPTAIQNEVARRLPSPLRAVIQRFARAHMPTHWQAPAD